MELDEIKREKEIRDLEGIILFLMSQIAMGSTMLRSLHMGLYEFEDRLEKLIGGIPVQLELDFDEDSAVNNIIPLFGDKIVH